MSARGNADALSGSDLFVRVQAMNGISKTTETFANSNDVSCSEYIVFESDSAGVYNVTLEDKDMIGAQVLHSCIIRADQSVGDAHISITAKSIKTSQDPPAVAHLDIPWTTVRHALA